MIQRPAWTRQPGSATGLDKSNPLTRGLTGFLNAGPGLKGDLVSGQPAWGVTGAQIATPDGHSIGNEASGTNGVYWDRSSNTATRGPAAFYPASPVMSAAVVATPTAYDGDRGLFVSSAGSDGWNIRSRFSDGTIQVSISDGSFRFIQAGAKLLLGRRNVIVITCDGATLTLYNNGANLGTAAVGGTNIAYDASFSQIVLNGALNPFGAVGFSGVAHYGAIWSRCLSPAEVAALALNPWQMYAPPARRIWPPSAVAPSTPTLSAATAFNITATTAQPRVTITI